MLPPLGMQICMGPSYSYMACLAPILVTKRWLSHTTEGVSKNIEILDIVSRKSFTQH